MSRPRPGVRGLLDPDPAVTAWETPALCPPLGDGNERGRCAGSPA